MPDRDRDLGDDVLSLRVDPRRDPGGRTLSAILNAQFAAEEAIRRRRFWTGVLAFLGLLATVALAFPHLLTKDLRIALSLIWTGAGVGWASNLFSEIGSARRLRSLTEEPESTAAPPAQRSQR
jgi:hypothetical protein